MTDALQKVETGALERPTFVKSSGAGTEHIEKKDLQLPRLALAQGLTPQAQEGNPKKVEGLNPGMMFNSITNAVIGGELGRGPLDFIILRADSPRAIEFYPRDQGGGVKDLNVPLNDPRCQFTTNEKQERVNPAATLFYDYMVLPLPLDMSNPEELMGKIIALSFKGAMLKKARELNTLIKLRDADIFAGVYRLGVATETNKKGTFYVFTVKNAGWLPDEASFAFAQKLFNALKDKKIEVDRTDAGAADEEIEFPPVPGPEAAPHTM